MSAKDKQAEADSMSAQADSMSEVLKFIQLLENPSDREAVRDILRTLQYGESEGAGQAARAQLLSSAFGELAAPPKPASATAEPHHETKASRKTKPESRATTEAVQYPAFDTIAQTMDRLLGPNWSLVAAEESAATGKKSGKDGKKARRQRDEDMSPAFAVALPPPDAPWTQYGAGDMPAIPLADLTSGDMSDLDLLEFVRRANQTQKRETAATSAAAKMAAQSNTGKKPKEPNMPEGLGAKQMAIDAAKITAAQKAAQEAAIANRKRRAQMGPGPQPDKPKSQAPQESGPATADSGTTATSSENGEVAADFATDGDVPSSRAHLDVEDAALEALLDEIDEDALQNHHMSMKLEVLPIETLRELMEPWSDLPNSTSDQLCNAIVETIRYLAAVYLLTVADKFHCLPETDDRIQLINNLMMSLWQGIRLLNSKVRDHIALLLGVPIPAAADEICVTVTGLGISSFFAAFDEVKLARFAKELGVEVPPLLENDDPDMLPDHYCRAICAHFYPSLADRQEMDHCCSVKTAVHENGANSYTCTIDNASMLTMIWHRTYNSPLFNCQRVKFRVKIRVDREGQLHFSVVQRQIEEPIKCSLALRSCSEAKAKKAAAAGAKDVLFLEKEGKCGPGCLLSFEKVCSVPEVVEYNKGPKVYNNIEDRIVLQFKLKIEETLPNSEPEAKEPPKKAAAAVDDDDDEPVAPAPGKGKKGAQPAGKKVPAKPGKQTQAEQKAAADAKKEAARQALLQEEEDEKKNKERAKQKQKVDKKLKQHEKDEQTARDKILQSQTSSWSTIIDEGRKQHNKAMQKQKDRERKQELARAQPSAELQKQLTELQQSTNASRHALSKLNQERNQLNKENNKTQSMLTTRSADLEALKEKVEALTTEEEELDAELEALELERDTAQKAYDEAQQLVEAAIAERGGLAALGGEALHPVSRLGDLASTDDLTTQQSETPPVAAPRASPSTMPPSSTGEPNSPSTLFTANSAKTSNANSRTATIQDIQDFWSTGSPGPNDHSGGGNNQNGPHHNNDHNNPPNPPYPGMFPNGFPGVPPPFPGMPGFPMSPPPFTHFPHGGMMPPMPPGGFPPGMFPHFHHHHHHHGNFPHNMFNMQQHGGNNNKGGGNPQSPQQGSNNNSGGGSNNNNNGMSWGGMGMPPPPPSGSQQQ